MELVTSLSYFRGYDESATWSNNECVTAVIGSSGAAGIQRWIW
jgi:hypothetical protein